MKVLFTLLILLFAVPIWARPGPLIVILLPGTSLQDWKTADAPNLHFLMSRGALAVMNTRTARLPGDKERETPESAVLTLGAGSRAAAPMTDPLSDKASWDAALRANTHLGYDVHLGNLTDALTSAGLQMAASRSGYASWLTEADPGNLSALLVRD